MIRLDALFNNFVCANVCNVQSDHNENIYLCYLKTFSLRESIFHSYDESERSTTFHIVKDHYNYYCSKTRCMSLCTYRYNDIILLSTRILFPSINL